MRTDNILRFAVVCVAVIVSYTMVLPSVAWASDIEHEPITQELIFLIGNNPEVGELLEKSIAEAQKVNPDIATNPVQSLPKYYDFVDHASKALPEDVLSSYKYKPVHDQMLQGLCYLHFLVNQPLTELEGKGLFDNTLQYYEPFASWFRHFGVVWGQYLDTEASWGIDIYEEIKADPAFHLDDGTYESPSNWNTFNRFFSRYLSSPSVRPIASPTDPTVIVSPGDSVPQMGPKDGLWPISSDSKIEGDIPLEVKGFRYYSIHDLLPGDSTYRDAFADGVLTHTFLNVFDYHRYHFAVGGTIKEKGILTRNVALDMKWDDVKKEYVPLDTTGWQFSQTLGYVILDTGKYGMVAVIPMGMSQVSSVNFQDDVKVGALITKGDMLGNFLFGGSDFIMLFQKEAKFKITAPKESETEYKHILMGEEYGRMGGAE